MIEEIIILCEEKKDGSRRYTLPTGLAKALLEKPGEVVIISSILMKFILNNVPSIYKEETEAKLINALAASLVNIDPTEDEFTYR